MCPRGVPCPSLYSPEGRVTELASFAMSDQFFYVGYRGWPVKTCSESLPDQCSGGCVVAVGSGVYVVLELDAIILGYTFEQHFKTCVFSHKFAVHQYVIL